MTLSDVAWHAVLALWFTLTANPAAGSQPARVVVVLYPDDNDGRPGNVVFDRGLRSSLLSGPIASVDVHNEYLDVARFSDAAYQENLADFLRKKYAGRKVDLVITGLASGLDFALKHRDRAFPGVPIIYAAVDLREIEARPLPRDIVGVPITMDLTATLQIALKQNPGTRRVYVVSGNSAFDKHWEAEARTTFAATNQGVEFVYLSGLPLDQLLETAAELPPCSVIYYLHVFQDGRGNAYIPAEVAEQLAARANAPVYGHVDTYVGRGIVGGRVFSFEAEGKNAAAVGLRILAGEKPEDLTFAATSANVDMFDWRQLQRWGISRDTVPAGSIVRFEQPGFWYQYRWHVIGIIALCVIESLLILGLMVERSNRRRAEARFRLMVEAAPIGILMVDRDGLIAMANPQVEQLFGYTKPELIGQPVEILLPLAYRDSHPGHREHYFAKAEVRSMGAGRDLHGQKKDGRQFPVEVGLSPLVTDAGMFVLASVVDVTERRRAEDGLRGSQRELRLLTGRLLQAQEEERRRIARELHDDLNQSLALLAVEIDLLVQPPPACAAPAGARLKKLSDQVRQISSAVHDLSHQLHPAKLEQLGLVAAVRGLCQELTVTHSTDISFRDHAIPDGVSAPVSLCLYRIAQEALQNSLKHSRCTRVDVTLQGIGGRVQLRVHDDGVGFELNQVGQNGSLGLLSMHERLRLVGGEIHIDSRPAGGTCIEVCVPLMPSEPANGELQSLPSTIS